MSRDNPVDAPVVVLGFVWGRLRYEKTIAGVGAADYFDGGGFKPWFLFWRRPFSLFKRGAADPKGWQMTHLQKGSPLGFLVYWPFCFHIWFHWKLQEFEIGEKNASGNYPHHWKPNTEQGIYLRSPGFRWDVNDGYFERTGGYVGSHWD